MHGRSPLLPDAEQEGTVYPGSSSSPTTQSAETEKLLLSYLEDERRQRREQEAKREEMKQNVSSRIPETESSRRVYHTVQLLSPTTATQARPSSAQTSSRQRPRREAFIKGGTQRPSSAISRRPPPVRVTANRSPMVEETMRWKQRRRARPLSAPFLRKVASAHVLLIPEESAQYNQRTRRRPYSATKRSRCQRKRLNQLVMEGKLAQATASSGAEAWGQTMKLGDPRRQLMDQALRPRFSSKLLRFQNALRISKSYNCLDRRGGGRWSFAARETL